MGQPVVHFAVYYDDAERARAFYESAFGWTFEAWGPPGYWKISTGHPTGIQAGALTKRTTPRGDGSPNAYRCTIAVDDVEAMMARIVSLGGTRASATVTIPHVGDVAEFTDPEGNLACVMRYDTPLT
ncbi:MAG: VOC family protein [Myxococcota bacterium]